MFNKGNEISAYDARNEATRHGTVVTTGTANRDGGWDFVVETENGDTVVSVFRLDNGMIGSAAI